MSGPEHFEVVEDRAVFRPTGHVSLQQAVQMVASAIALARERKVRKLLVVTTGLTGFEPPDVSARHKLASEWANAASGEVCVAVVAKREMLDPQKFGVFVAAKRGLVTDVFTSEEKARLWLEGVK